MLQRYDEDSSSTPPASDGERSGRRRIFPVIERTFPQFLVIAILVPLLVFGFAAYRDWQDVQAEAGARITYVRDALAEHALRVFKTHELAAYAVRDRVRDRSWSRIAASADMSSFLASLAESFPEIASSHSLTLPAPCVLAAKRSRPSPGISPERAGLRNCGTRA